MRIFKKTVTFFGVFCLLIILVSCTLTVNTPTPPVTAVPQTVQQISPKPMPSPVITPEPSPSPTEEVLEYKGTGNDSILDVSLPFTVSVLRFKHEGTGVFAVTDYSGKDKRLLLNASGEFYGSTLIYGDEKHSIKIESDGKWEVKIETPLLVADDKYSGKGCDVSQMMFGGGNEEWAVINKGKGDFIVYAYYTNGGGNKCILSKKGNYKGTVKIKLPEIGMIIFTVVSDGEWTLERTKTELKI